MSQLHLSDELAPILVEPNDVVEHEDAGISDIDRACEIYSFLAAGGDDERMCFTVYPGNPVSKHRARFARNGRVFPDPRQLEAEATLGSWLRQMGDDPFRGTVAVGCIFFRATQQSVDVDNLLKHVLDSANGILWVDDRQVTAVLGILEVDPDRPRTVIIVGRHQSTLVRDVVIAGVCEVCGEGFEHPGWRKRRQRFCSSACVARSRGQDLSELVPCVHCATPFKRRNSYQNLCSESCRVDWFRGKKKAEASPNYCMDCGTPTPNHKAKRCRACWLKARKAGIA